MFSQSLTTDREMDGPITLTNASSFHVDLHRFTMVSISSFFKPRHVNINFLKGFMLSIFSFNVWVNSALSGDVMEHPLATNSSKRLSPWQLEKSRLCRLEFMTWRFWETFNFLKLELLPINLKKKLDWCNNDLKGHLEIKVTA